MKRVICSVGTRPEAIKLAPVVHALRSRSSQFQVALCATGQHADLASSAFELFDLRPDFDLALLRPGQQPADVLARAVQGLTEVFTDWAANLVIVQGDTTSTLAATLAAAYQQIPVAHVEAGLRSGDLGAPFPEEINRSLVDRVSDWMFAPTPEAAKHLLLEGSSPERVMVTGNTGIDAFREARERRARPGWKSRIDAFLHRTPLDGRYLVLATAHRRESFGAPLRSMLNAVRSLAERADVQVVFPVHPNPEVRHAVEQTLAGSRVLTTEPMDYAVSSFLLDHAHLVLTDSGGVTEEACFAGIPTLVLRERTERPEAVAAGVAKVVGTKTADILTEANRLLDSPAAHDAMARPSNAFGDGRASEKIAERLATA